jgi:uncharacterized repeat protein (TIGR03803 family)
MAMSKGWKRVWVVFLLCASTGATARAQTFNTLVSFDLTDGANPEYEALVQGSDGSFYGTTELGGKINQYCNGGTTCGTVFKISPGGALTTLHMFEGADGYYPSGGLVLATDGNFYGTTFTGGPDYYGTVFKITPAGTLTTLHSFVYTDGAHPNGGSLVQAADGDFYGTTVVGGANKQGTVFKMTAKGTLTTLYSFCAQSDCADGEEPQGGLVQATDGSFYGITSVGGNKNSCQYGCGTIFKITSGGTLTTLHNFDSSDGADPNGLVQAADGNFYGATGAGGAYGWGTLFKITPRGTLTTIYGFCAQANCKDGAGPWWPVQASDRNLYGVTSAGGAYGYGTAFKITPRGTLTTLFSFCTQAVAADCIDGRQPSGALFQATDGNFYGTTYWGGEILNPACAIYPPFYGCGTAFSVDAGLVPFAAFVRNSAKIGQAFGILGQGFTGTIGVSLNGRPAKFKVVSDTFITATVPQGATSGYVAIATSGGNGLTSNVKFHVIK